jgi:hypothetical protein
MSLGTWNSRVLIVALKLRFFAAEALPAANALARMAVDAAN